MFREIKVLQDFPHDNIVHLQDIFRQHGKLYLIFDYIERTLLEELQARQREDEDCQGLPPEQIKMVTYQILKSVQFLHASKVLHRDVKPENLLISTNGVVKLCDFGFARGIKADPKFQYTDYVSTRWYRAPELLVGDANYN